MSAEIVNIEMLIAAVEARPCLWDKTTESYKDRNQTIAAWTEVCTSLKEHYHYLEEGEKAAFNRLIVKRWTNIRDSFRKYVKVLNTNKKSKKDGSNVKKYVYYEQMLFLLKVFGEYNANDDADDDANDDDDIALSEMVKVAIHPEYNSTAPTPTHRPSISSTTSTQPTSRKRYKMDPVEEKLLKAIDDQENPHLSFCKGFLPTIQDFNDDETIDFQMGVLQLIRNIKKKRKF